MARSLGITLESKVLFMPITFRNKNIIVKIELDNISSLIASKKLFKLSLFRVEYLPFK